MVNVGLVGVATLALAAGSVAARGLVPSGLYEVTVTQEVPNVARTGEPIKVEACLQKRAIESAAAFHVRGDSPLRECPLSDVRFNGEELIYRIVCPQSDAPSAKAKFVWTRTGYEGAITLKQGAVVMTERHSAQRIGECPNDDSASVLDLHEDLLPEHVKRGRRPTTSP